MVIDSTDLEAVTVDGQRIFLPTPTQLKQLLGAGELDGIAFLSPSVSSLLPLLVEETTKHQNDLVLGFYRASPVLKSWLPLVLLKVESGFQRVLTEYVTCGHCGWQGLIANPDDLSLYFGTEDDFEYLKKGARTATKACPNCGGKLPRSAAWVEPLQ